MNDVKEEILDFKEDLTIKEGFAVLAAFAAIYSMIVLTIVILIADINVLEGAISNFMSSYSPYFRVVTISLMFGAAIAIPFFITLILEAENTLERIGSTLLLLSNISYFFISYFPLEVYPEHVLAAISWMTLLIFSLWFYGSGKIMKGKKRMGLLLMWAGCISLTVWTTWAAWRVFAPGLLLPEYLGGVLPFGIVVTYLSVKYYRDEL